MNKGGRHYWFAKYLKKAGYNPTIFCCNSVHGTGAQYYDDDNLWHEHVDEVEGIHAVFVRARTYTKNGIDRVLCWIDFYRNVKKAAKEYAKLHGKPDVIMASSVHPLTLVAGIQLAKQFGVKCVCEVRDLWPESLVAYGIAGPHNPAVLFLRRLEKWIYQKADALIFTMEGAYDYIIEQGWEKDIPRTKVHYINNGVDLEVFDYNKEHYQVDDPDLEDPDTFKVVYAGSIRRANNLGLLLEAAKKVTDPRVRFLIWGDGGELPMLKQRTVDEKIKNVIFKGRVAKKCVPYIVSYADVNFIDVFDERLSRYGISSNKLFEYFAAERPLLISDILHSPMGKTPCKVGYTSDADSIADGIHMVISSEKEKYVLMCNGARQAAEKYSFEVLTEKLITICEELQ